MNIYFKYILIALIVSTYLNWKWLTGCPQIYHFQSDPLLPFRSNRPSFHRHGACLITSRRCTRCHLPIRSGHDLVWDRRRTILRIHLRWHLSTYPNHYVSLYTSRLYKYFLRTMCKCPSHFSCPFQSHRCSSLHYQASVDHDHGKYRAHPFEYPIAFAFKVLSQRLSLGGTAL